MGSRSCCALMLRALLFAAAAAAVAQAAAPHASPARATHRWVYDNYTFNNSKDTFELCKEQSGLKREVPLEELLPHFGLPSDLVKRKAVTLAQLLEMTAASAPSATLVVAPMLHADADVAAAASRGLPRLVHFTVRDKDSLMPHQVVSIVSWAARNPGYSVLLWDDADIGAFMAAHYPSLQPTFAMLASPVERTDMWRYLVLCTFGGVYADSDVVAAKPVDEWDARGAGLLVGIENVFTTLEAARRRTYTRMMQMVQWTMAARPGHPVVCRMGTYVAAHVADEAAGVFVDADRDHAILERTGPGIWSSSVHDFLLQAGAAIEDTVAGALVGDVRVLPQTVLGCASSTWNPSDPVPYVYHMFKGSWRQERPSRLKLLLHAIAPCLFPLPPPTRKGKGAGAAPAAEPAQQGQQRAGASLPRPLRQQESRRLRAAVAPGASTGGHPSTGLAMVPALCALLILAGLFGTLARSGGSCQRTRLRPGGLGASASASNLLLLASSGGGGGKLSGGGGAGAGGVVDLTDREALALLRPGSPPLEAVSVACATGSAAGAGAAHAGRMKRSWGSFSSLRALQQL